MRIETKKCAKISYFRFDGEEIIANKAHSASM